MTHSQKFLRLCKTKEYSVYLLLWFLSTHAQHSCFHKIGKETPWLSSLGMNGRPERSGGAIRDEVRRPGLQAGEFFHSLCYGGQILAVVVV
jgi:hypothetical protein